MQKFGQEEGEICGRDWCKGVVAVREPKDCSCHISPPCNYCTEDRRYCTECDWEGINDYHINDHVVSVNPKTGVYKHSELRPLDSTMIDWHSFSHTHASMIKRGVYPEGTTIEQVREKVNGTFGGRFNSFGNGKFEFIAYTD